MTAALGPGDGTWHPSPALGYKISDPRVIHVGRKTRIYSGDEDAANAADPVLGLIEQAQRRETLVARVEGSRYHFDIRLQGDPVTVFLDL